MTSSIRLVIRLSLMLSVLLPLSLAFPYCYMGPCQKGQFLEYDSDGSPVCQPCPPKTYMDEDNHMCRDCFHCMEVMNYRYERTLVECTPEADRVVGCVEGYYRVPDGDPKVSGFCEKCTICADDEIIDKECGNYSDTHCSKRPGTQETPKQSVTEETFKQLATEETSKHHGFQETPTDAGQPRSTVEDGLEDQKPKTLIIAGLTDNDVESPQKGLVASICALLAPLVVIFSIKICLDFPTKKD